MMVSLNPPSQSTAQPANRRAGGRKSAKSDLLSMQAILLERLKDPKTTDCDKARLALAWERLEERLRILRGKPLPGMLRPDLVKPKARPTPLVLVPPSEQTA
jgi:hypothetical protein